MMLRVAFAGTFAAHLVEPVRARLDVPCDVVAADEADIVTKLAEVDVLVALAFTGEMGAVARRLRLLQVPGAGVDRIDRAALPAGTHLANAYAHEIGIAEYVLGAILVLRRELVRLAAELRRGAWASQWAVGLPAPPAWPELTGRTLGILLATGESARKWPDEPAPSAWTPSPSAAIPRSRTRTVSPPSAVPTPSTT